MKFDLQVRDINFVSYGWDKTKKGFKPTRHIQNKPTFVWATTTNIQAHNPLTCTRIWLASVCLILYLDNSWVFLIKYKHLLNIKYFYLPKPTRLDMSINFRELIALWKIIYIICSLDHKESITHKKSLLSEHTYKYSIYCI